MAQAAQFLKETTQPVSTISTMVGYANPLHFSRAFKSVYGISPRAYRQTHLPTRRVCEAGHWRKKANCVHCNMEKGRRAPGGKEGKNAWKSSSAGR